MEDGFQSVLLEDDEFPAPVVEPAANSVASNRFVPKKQPQRSQSSIKKNKKSKKKSTKRATITKIEVKNPEKRGENINAYIVYKIFTEWSDNAHHRVERRYTDFKWLHDVLGIKIKGVIIPPIPSKDFFGRFMSSDFVEKRRRGLEQFLKDVARHSELKETDEFRTFLLADRPTLQLAMVEEQQPSGWFTMVTDLKDKFLSPATMRDETDQDRRCDEVTEYANRLLTIITQLDQQVQDLMTTSKAQSQYWFQMGVSMQQLGKFQRDNGFRRIGDALDYIGRHSDSTSNLLSQKIVIDETRKWSEPINRYKKLVVAIQEMMRGRKDLYNTLNRENRNLVSLKTKIKTVTGDQRNQLQNEISMSEQRVACLEGELESVTDRLFEEFENFKQNKAEELQTLILEFGRIQANYHAKMAESWNDVLNCVENNSYPSETHELDEDFVEWNEM